MLVISTESRHFAYYKWLRSLYGYDTSDTTSLCPYCQTIIWGSIFCLFLSPVLVLGWSLMYAGRLIMKLNGPWFDKIINYIDNCQVGEYLDKGPTNFEESPLVAGMFYTVMGLLLVGACLSVVLVLFSILAFLGLGVWHIEEVLTACWATLCKFGSGVETVVLCMGWLVFCGFGYIGFAMDSIASGAYWLFTNGELWKNIGKWTVVVVGALVAGSIVSGVLGYTFMLISRTGIVQGLLRAIAGIVRGKWGAMTSSRNARIAACFEARKKLPPITCHYCSTVNAATRNGCSHCERKLIRRREFLLDKPPGMPLRIGRAVYSGLVDRMIVPAFGLMVVRPMVGLFGSIQRLGNTDFRLLGWVTILWEFVKAIKRGVCPMVEFMSPGDMQERARVGARERNAKF